MQLSFKYLIPVAVLGLAPSLKAQDPTTSAWTLQQCFDYAMEHNLDLRQKNIDVSLADVEVYARQGALFPSLSFATNQNVSWRPWSQSYVNITDGTMSSTTSTVNYNGSYGLQAQWTVWNGGINRKRLQLSRVSKQQAETDVETTRLSLQEQIVQLYVQILYQTEAVQVCSSILESTKIQLDRAETMYEIGSMSKADLAQVQAQVSQEEYNVANATTQLDEFKLQLRQLLELPASSDFNVVVPAIDEAKVLASLPEVSAVYAAAVESRPEIKNSQLGMTIADLDLDIAKRGRYPTISLQGGINTSASSGLDTSWARQIKTNLSNSLGLTLSVPIFDNRQNSANISKARLEKENSQVALDKQCRQLHDNIESLWLNASNSQEQFRYALSNVDSMRESYKLVSEQFAVGLKDIVALITSKNNLVQSEQQLLQSKYTTVLNRALLDFYNGENLSLK